ncbi:MAG: aldose epimerase family protein [Flavobacteriaceae bacterium]
MENIDSITLYNNNGLKARFVSLGARWTEMHVPDHNGLFEDILLGPPEKEDYLQSEEKYYGAVVGRYCGRIPNGVFNDDDVKFKLPLKDSGKHHLHGGENGFHMKNWEIIPEYSTDRSVGFHLFSEDGSEGYPGNLEVSIVYTLTDNDQVIFEVKAKTDKKTLVNITNHAFFNLTGSSKDLEGHKLFLYGDQLVQTDEYVLTGEIREYRKPYEVVLKDKVSLAFLLKKSGNRPDVVLIEPISGRYLNMYTDQTAIQLYNGFFMNGTDMGKNGVLHYPNTGLAIEPQYLYPSSFRLLSPSKDYVHRTVYEFGVEMNQEYKKHKKIKRSKNKNSG